MPLSSTGKRYIDLPGVKISNASIPVELLPLLEPAKKWAIVGDTALERAIRKDGKAKIRQVVDLATPLKEEIDRFAHESKGSKLIPVPHEVVLFQMFAWSLKNLEVEAR